jgi:hypothetical protein
VAPKAVETVDLSTPPVAQVQTSREDEDASKRSAAAKRKETRCTNKQVQATFLKEVKVSLAEGRPPAMNVKENQTHLKARWHAAAKEAAYKFLDLRKEGWKAYTPFEKALVHNEIEVRYKFEPPLDPLRIDKFLASHLRSARAVWKSHWKKFGDDIRHPNCPEAAWQSLIKWWKTAACKDEAAAMARRRKKVKKANTTGRKELMDRMEDEVRQSTPDCYSGAT